MQGCSFPISCWLGEHLIVVWIFLLVCGLVSLIMIVASLRMAYALYRSQVEHSQQDEEQRREEKVLLHRMKRTIRIGEEWNVDVSQLRLQANTIVLLRTLHDVLLAQQARIAVPLALGGIISTVGSPLLVVFSHATWLALLLIMLTVGWFVVALWHWLRYRRLKRVVEHIVQQLRKQEDA